MKRFRFSLLTFVVAMLMMAGILYLNLQPSPMVGELPIFSIEEGRTIYPEHVHDSRRYGWPFQAASEWYARRFADPTGPVVMQGLDWYWRGLAKNVLVSLALVFAGGAACEWLVHRRAKETEAR